MRNKLLSLLNDWHEAGRASWPYKNLDYDQDQRKVIKEAKKYFYLDVGTGGAFICEKSTGNIYRLKSKYGVPNRKKLVGNVDTVTGADLDKYRWW